MRVCRRSAEPARGEAGQVGQERARRRRVCPRPQRPAGGQRSALLGGPPCAAAWRRHGSGAAQAGGISFWPVATGLRGKGRRMRPEPLVRRPPWALVPRAGRRGLLRRASCSGCTMGRCGASCYGCIVGGWEPHGLAGLGRTWSPEYNHHDA